MQAGRTGVVILKSAFWLCAGPTARWGLAACRPGRHLRNRVFRAIGGPGAALRSRAGTARIRPAAYACGMTRRAGPRVTVIR
jgi:hypothetical protein